jgi:hypothetical protein
MKKTHELNNFPLRVLMYKLFEVSVVLMLFLALFLAAATLVPKRQVGDSVPPPLSRSEEGEH